MGIVTNSRLDDDPDLVDGEGREVRRLFRRRVNSCMVFEESIQSCGLIIWVTGANRSVQRREFTVIEGIVSGGPTTGNHLEVRVEYDIDRLERTRNCQLNVG